MGRTMLYLVLSLTLVPATVKAGEGYKEKNSGVTVLLSELGLTSDEVYQRPAHAIDINRTVWVRGGSPEFVTLSATNAEITAFVQNITVAMGLWENIPTARLDFAIGSFRTISSAFSKDGMNVATLAGGTYPYGGQGGGHLAAGDFGVAEIVEFDVILRRSTNSDNANSARGIMTQEIGHGVGFNHSWLTRDAVLDLTGATSLVSMMSYGSGKQAVLDAGVLNPDDLALASRLYPNSFRRLSGTTGSIRGRVMNYSAASELYGADVLLVDPSTGRAILSRISGYATSRPLGTKDGLFLLDGVPPGTYDVLVAARDDSLVSLGSPDPSIDYMILNSGGSTGWPDALASFASGFSRAWVRGIPVQAGEIVDLGYVLAGIDRSFEAPSRLDVTARYTGSASYSAYWFDFWSNSPYQMEHRSGQVASRDYTARLVPGWHAVKIFGLSSSGWITLVDWTWRDHSARRQSFTWNRSFKSVPITSRFGSFTLLLFRQAEVIDYIFHLSRPGLPYLVWAPVHGQRYTLHVVPGEYDYRVLGQFNTSEAAFTVQGSTHVSVP